MQILENVTTVHMTVTQIAIQFDALPQNNFAEALHPLCPATKRAPSHCHPRSKHYREDQNHLPQHSAACKCNLPSGRCVKGKVIDWVASLQKKVSLLLHCMDFGLLCFSTRIRDVSIVLLNRLNVCNHRPPILTTFATLYKILSIQLLFVHGIRFTSRSVSDFKMFSVMHGFKTGVSKDRLSVIIKYRFPGVFLLKSLHL
jgi:hypothetical protein